MRRELPRFSPDFAFRNGRMDAECAVPIMWGGGDGALKLQSKADGSEVELSGREWPRPGLQAALGDELQLVLAY
jgi:hypothetical protein